MSWQKVQGREANRRRHRLTEPAPKALCQPPPPLLRLAPPWPPPVSMHQHPVPTPFADAPHAMPPQPWLRRSPMPPTKKIQICIPEPPDYPTPPLLWPLLSPNLSPPPPPQVSAGVGKPPHGPGECIGMHLVNGTGNGPSPGRPTPGVVKQDKSSGGSVDTTKTRLGPQRVRMSSGKRPIGTAKGKQSDTEALCQPPPPPIPFAVPFSCPHAYPALARMLSLFPGREPTPCTESRPALKWRSWAPGPAPSLPHPRRPFPFRYRGSNRRLPAWDRWVGGAPTRLGVTGVASRIAIARGGGPAHHATEAMSPFRNRPTRWHHALGRALLEGERGERGSSRAVAEQS